MVGGRLAVQSPNICGMCEVSNVVVYVLLAVGVADSAGWKSLAGKSSALVP